MHPASPGLGLPLHTLRFLEPTPQGRAPQWALGVTSVPQMLCPGPDPGSRAWPYLEMGLGHVTSSHLWIRAPEPVSPFSPFIWLSTESQEHPTRGMTMSQEPGPREIHCSLPQPTKAL